MVLKTQQQQQQNQQILIKAMLLGKTELHTKEKPEDREVVT